MHIFKYHLISVISL